MAGHELYISEMLDSFKEEINNTIGSMKESMDTMVNEMKSVASELTSLEKVTASGIKDPQTISSSLDVAENVVTINFSKSLSGNTERTDDLGKLLSYCHGTVKVIPNFTFKRTDKNTTYLSNITLKVGDIAICNNVTFDGGDVVNFTTPVDLTFEYGSEYAVSLNIKGNCADARVSVEGKIDIAYNFANIVENGAVMLTS